MQTVFDESRDPYDLFVEIFKQAHETDHPLPMACQLATANQEARPSVRTILLRGHEPSAFRFYTNYDSQKAAQLDSNPHAELLFWWPQLKKQIRVAGEVIRCTAAVSDGYFASRPVESQWAAIASKQSHVLESFASLFERYEAVKAKGPPARPPNWGGYELQPQTYEFWNDRAHRLHERLRFRREGQAWKAERLGP